MPATGVRRSAKKSRGGCVRCKAQHIKCDEAKPHCGRCERLGMKCPGYATQLKWSTKHEVHQEPTAPASGTNTAASEYDWLEFNLPPATPATINNMISPASNDNSPFTGIETPYALTVEPFWDATEGILEPELSLSLLPHHAGNSVQQPLLQALGVRRRNTEPRLPSSLTNQPYELISYYFKVVPSVYSTFDSHKNPFRSAVSSLYSHSLAVNLAAQSMAAAYLAEVHPSFAELGRSLRQQCLDIVHAEQNNNYDTLLALMMSGPTSNWHEAKDLGLSSYDSMRSRLAALASTGKQDSDYGFFSEAMILWEMFLCFTSDSGIIQKSFSPLSVAQFNPSKREIHPWTGVGGNTLKVVADIGRLVRRNRQRSRSQAFVTQSYIEHMGQDLIQARELERRLLACQHPDDKDVVNTEDSATPVWHITTIAELHRYAGLLQLYRVFPDLLSERLHGQLIDADGVADLTQLPVFSTSTVMDHNQWLRNFSMEALRQLETIPSGSGTIDFHPFLLVTFASELACESTANADEQSNSTAFANSTFGEVAIMRKLVMDRLTSCCRQIPPKPLRVCLDIVKETWRRIDSGQQNVYWVDVMIENGWETIMA